MGQLPGLTRAHPVTVERRICAMKFLPVFFLLLTVSAACFVPATKLLKIDLVESLRHE